GEAIYISSGNPVHDIRNNIFTSGNNYAFYTSSANYIGTLDHNLYDANFANLAFHGSARADLAAWQTAYPTMNINSVQGDPIFAGQFDLHLTTSTLADSAGAGLSLAFDIDGDVRDPF